MLCIRRLSSPIFKRNRTIISEKIKEAFLSVLPITIIILILSFTIAPVPSGNFLTFIIGSVLLIVGMGLFTLGSDIGMTPIGEYVGSTIVKTKKLFLIIPVTFVLGLIITIAEPDLSVLANQVSGIENIIIMLFVGVGVGLFLVVAFLRIVFKIQLKYILIILYSIVFIIAAFVPNTFIPIAFDSGGVTTGPMTVPFLISIGTGVSALRIDSGTDDDSFGLTAICSIGPIISTMLLGLLFDIDSTEVSGSYIPVINDSREAIILFGKSLPKHMFEILIAILPITIFFFVFKFFGAPISKNDLIKIIIGLLYTFIGLFLFLLGVNVGFLPIGTYLGKTIGGLEANWIAIPLGMIIGYYVVAAEPSVHVLTKQVYEITIGAISKKSLRFSLMIGVAISIGISMARILLKINILYLLIPGYLIAIILSIFVPDIFVSIAFDSGGVASGTMTASFILPFALGICEASGGNIATDGFGVVAMVAMTPLITIQLLGLICVIKNKRIKKSLDNSEYSEEIIE